MRWQARLVALFLVAGIAQASTPIPLDAATIADLNAAFAARTLTSERLVRMYLERIRAYDDTINSVVVLNPDASKLARALDAERRLRGPRSALHGIPVLLKDNFDTFDLPTTGGSLLLEGSIPPDDAYTVRRLREAGAIVLGKVNMAEFAYGETHGSLIGQTFNPHDPIRSTSGSSGGTAAAVAATFAAFGMGTDTSGSIRTPASFTGIVGLRPTTGLLSRDGIIPLALTFDTPGPMGRSVYDVAVALGLMTGVDAADTATQGSAGKFLTDYTTQLDSKPLRGARIGVARDFFGADADVDAVIEAALATLRQQGAVLVDIHFPQWLLDSTRAFDRAIHFPEFHTQIATYLATTGPTYPKTLEQMIERTKDITTMRSDGAGPSTWRWDYFKREGASVALDDYTYTSVRDHGIPLVRAALSGAMAKDQLDAIVYPAAQRRPAVLNAKSIAPNAPVPSPIYLASLSGFPDLNVPAGFTGEQLPVGLSFLGLPFTEAQLLALGFSFEKVQRARRLPRYTPALTGQSIRLPYR